MVSGIMFGQVKTSIAVKDLNSGIEKYIKKNYEGYKAVEAFQYAPCYEVVLQGTGTTENLIFDAKGKMLAKKTDAIIPVRTRTSMAVKDVNSDIEKYVKKNYEGYKISEAYMYDLAYSVKITKENSEESLLFDKDGKYVKKIVPPAVVKEPAKKMDTVPAKEVKKEEPKKEDTLKK